jgi:hypothetical protein
MRTVVLIRVLMGAPMVVRTAVLVCDG